MFLLVKDIRYTHALTETMIRTSSKNFTMCQFLKKEPTREKFIGKTVIFNVFQQGLLCYMKSYIKIT